MAAGVRHRSIIIFTGNAITYIAVHPNYPDIVYVTQSGFSSGEKIFVSIDGGGSWTNISGNLPNLPVN